MILMPKALVRLVGGELGYWCRSLGLGRGREGWMKRWNNASCHYLLVNLSPTGTRGSHQRGGSVGKEWVVSDGDEGEKFWWDPNLRFSPSLLLQSEGTAWFASLLPKLTVLSSGLRWGVPPLASGRWASAWNQCWLGQDFVTLDPNSCCMCPSPETRHKSWPRWSHRDWFQL